MGFKQLSQTFSIGFDTKLIRSDGGLPDPANCLAKSETILVRSGTLSPLILSRDKFPNSLLMVLICTSLIIVLCWIAKIKSSGPLKSISVTVKQKFADIPWHW